MRLIDADELIEVIKSYHGDMLINEIIDVISEQPTVNDWIPSDQPPKSEDYILLSFENFSVPLVGMYRNDGDGGAYYVGDDDESCISQNIIVNGWMPVPKRYDLERSNT